MLATRGKTERPRGALLQLGIEFDRAVYSIGGRPWSRVVRSGGAASGIPPSARLEL